MGHQRPLGIHTRKKTKAWQFHVEMASDVRREQNDCIAEVDITSVPICKRTFFQDLQKRIGNVRMRFVKFIKEENRIGAPMHTFSQEASLFITDIARLSAKEF